MHGRRPAGLGSSGRLGPEFPASGQRPAASGSATAIACTATRGRQSPVAQRGPPAKRRSPGWRVICIGQRFAHPPLVLQAMEAGSRHGIAAALVCRRAFRKPRGSRRPGRLRSAPTHPERPGRGPTHSAAPIEEGSCPRGPASPDCTGSPNICPGSSGRALRGRTRPAVWRSRPTVTASWPPGPTRPHWCGIGGGFRLQTTNKHGSCVSRSAISTDRRSDRSDLRTRIAGAAAKKTLRNLSRYCHSAYQQFAVGGLT